jgi:hypothetical protein
MKIAIQTAKIAYPDYERESGTKWPDKHLDPAEAQLFAFAALRALDGAGFDIVPKKDSPMPTGPKGGEARRRPRQTPFQAISLRVVSTK